MKKSERDRYWKILTGMLKWTTPNGTEKDLEKFLPPGGIWDEKDNYILVVGDKTCRHMFCSHLDTACSTKHRVKWQYRNGIISTTNNSILGADDKAGVLVMISMIEHKIPGTYIFHAGEERGTIGSQYIVTCDEIKLPNYDIAVSFDRRDINSIITHQSLDECCSPEFAKFLGNALNMSPDDTGTYTDTANYLYEIPECTNISVGFQNEHRDSETLNASWLIEVMIPKVLAIDWNKAPIVRECEAPKKYSYRYNKLYKPPISYNGAGGQNYHYNSIGHPNDEYDDDDYYYRNHSRYLDPSKMSLTEIRAKLKTAPEESLYLDDCTCVYIADKIEKCCVCNKNILITENVYMISKGIMCQKCSYSPKVKIANSHVIIAKPTISVAKPITITTGNLATLLLKSILENSVADVINDGDTLSIFSDDEYAIEAISEMQEDLQLEINISTK